MASSRGWCPPAARARGERDLPGAVQKPAPSTGGQKPHIWSGRGCAAAGRTCYRAWRASTSWARAPSSRKPGVNPSGLRSLCPGEGLRELWVLF